MGWRQYAIKGGALAVSYSSPMGRFPRSQEK